MDLRRKISYQWQLFIPLVITLWVVIFGMAFWQLYNERQYRMAQINEQLSLVNARIIAAYERNSDITPFLSFVVDYYRENPIYDLLRVSLYQDGRLVRCYGEPISLSDEEKALSSGLTRTPGVSPIPAPGNKYFYYQASTTSDGRLTVYTVLPFDNDIMTAATPSLRVLWVFVAIAIAMTVLSFYSTRYFGRNIKILRTIAERAATDPNFMPAMDYPHDELGDISRQISHMYNERSQAMQRQEREHAIALNAIQEKARAKRVLTNNINHELRTPIGVIKGYLDTIVDNPEMDEASRTHFLLKAQEHVNRLVNLIADVSAITRLEEGSELVSTEEMDFHDCVYSISHDLEESKTLGEMKFTYNVPLNCRIMGNYNLLSGMIINLAKNAAAYSKGDHCEMVLDGEDDKMYTFIFRDNGVGVSEEHLPHLFDRFYRVDTGRARKSGGSGLGLPIVQSTIKAHGGEIEVFNGSDSGLNFRFTLPKCHSV